VAGSDKGETLPLARKVVSDPGLSDLVLLRRAKAADGSGVWEPLATGDIPFAAIAHADAWLLVEPESEGYAAGRMIFARYL
jgi:molybdopterin biosynthesis enzyme